MSSGLPLLPQTQPPVALAALETFETVWLSNERDDTESVGWGDVDGDGDLDLAVGNDDEPVRLYRNENGRVTTTAVWSSVENPTAHSLAWGDVDGDGDLDLAVANRHGSSYLYRNDGGTLTDSAVWSSAESHTQSICWGDVDGDGDLDLVAAGDGILLYRNDSGSLTTNAVWSATDNYGSAVAWGDIDRDGDLDLVAASGRLFLYRNDSGSLTTTAVWSSTDDGASLVALGDMDGDGDLDVVTAYGYAEEGGYVKVYRNDGGALTAQAIWLSTEYDYTTSVNLGDIDGDGDLDLATGSFGETRIYRNEGFSLTASAVWTSTEGENVTGVALGDVDRDGDLDIAAGIAQSDDSIYYPNRIYRNEGGVLSETSVWSPLDSSGGETAWGDVDSDGDLDLAIGTRLYRNNGGVLTGTSVWSASDITASSGIAWGDVDGDRDLDLAVGGDGRYDSSCQCNVNYQSRLYRNDGGTLTTRAVWLATELGTTTSVAWGDVDGDGDLDLAIGNEDDPSRVYRNDAGSLTTSAVWSSTEADTTNSLAWGDVDNDGDLDLATGTYGYPSSAPNRLYRNDKGTLTTSAVWSSNERDITTDVAWGDVDGDGDLDLAVANAGQSNRLYRNDKGVLTAGAVWSASDTGDARSLAWGDVDGDGDLDLAFDNLSSPTRLYQNDGGALTPRSVWISFEASTGSSVAWGDFDSDGDVDLAAGTRLYRSLSNTSTPSPNTPPNVVVTGPQLSVGGAKYASATILGAPVIPIYYRLADAKSGLVSSVRAEYSLNGGDNWQLAVPAEGTITTNLATSPSGTPHIFNWDVGASSVFGQSDNVVFRIHALPDLRARPRQAPGLFQHPASTASSLPFRLRGTQPRVLSPAGEPLRDVVVYRLPQGAKEGATLVTEANGGTFRTNHLGYLEGRGRVALGDRLMALREVGRSEQYTLYHTSAAPTAAGLDAHIVASPGVQTLAVSPDNALMLLHLSVSLEWDARSDADFMQRLRNDLRRVSSSLYAWSDGQIALGTITLHQNKDRWDDQFDARGNLVQKGADIRIRATNRLRPNAGQGGITLAERADPDVPTILYEPGHVRIGAVWNRDGSPEQRELSADWALALAHELGHYALFLDDNYLGLNASRQLVSVAGCRGAMSDPYSAAPSDFRPDADWLPACEDTLSNRNTVRSDWATIQRFYNGVAPGFQLRQPASYGLNPGPSALPLAVTQFVEPAPPPGAPATTQAIALVRAEGGTYAASDSARAFRFSGDGTRIADLGEPASGQVIARGMQAGDTVCVYDVAGGRSGCGSGSALALQSRPGWQPDVLVTPVNSRTLQLAVPAASVGAAPASGLLKARLFPSDSAQAPTDADLALSNGQYQGVLTLPGPVLEGYVRVWVDEPAPRREVVTDYAIGGNPAPPRRPPRRSRRKAPMISPDGQVLLLADDIDFKPGEFFALQTVTHLPEPPGYAAPLGAGYRLIASNPAPSLAGVGINIAFATSDLPAGGDGWVALYYYPPDGSGWRRLSALPGRAGSSEVNAQVVGPGIYALMASVPFAIGELGWNQLPYPGASAALPDALRPVAGAYRMVYGFDADDADDPWKIYAPALPAWANDLRQLERGEPYWVYVTDPLTAPVRPADAAARAAPRAGEPLTFPPALFYGALTPTGDFLPTAGLAVEAEVNGTVCGTATTRDVGGQVVFAIDVRASSSGGDAACGTRGAPITITIGDYEWPLRPAWDNTRLNELRIYAALLPLVQGQPGPPAEPTPLDEPEE